MTAKRLPENNSRMHLKQFMVIFLLMAGLFSGVTMWWIIREVFKSTLTSPLQKEELNLILYIAGFVVFLIISYALIWKSQQL